jgi:protein-tyrosine phosphatase
VQDSRPTDATPPFDVPLLLTVCTGNVCRSPMAEALLRHHLALVGLPAVVASAGTLGWNSAGPTDHTLTALSERGVELEGHISRRMNAGLLAPASLVIAMTNDHMDGVRNHHPESVHRTFVLGQLVRLGEKHGARGSESLAEWVASVDALRIRRHRALPGDEIRDPLGEPLDAYQLLAAQLDDLTARLARLLAGPISGSGRTAVGAISEDALK